METRPFAKQEVNNEIYDQFGESWYTESSDAVVLLRTEGRLKNPWVEKVIISQLPNASRSPGDARILDIGCGGGFLSNYLAEKGFRVVGVDQSESSLHTARRHDATQSVVYEQADAYHLPYPDGTFDVACAMDFLEHVEEPDRVVAEASRVLKPGGIFFFHTFNRNWISNLVVIKGMEWLIRNVPPRLHVHRLFIKPDELARMCESRSMPVQEMLGIRPKFGSFAVLKALMTGVVTESFRFEFTSSLAIAYAGYARKQPLTRQNA